jgi:hypothetical protein
MGLFSRRAGTPASTTDPSPTVEKQIAEHSVIARYELPPGPTGTAADGQSLFRLEENLARAIHDARAGEFEGNELGSGGVTLYAYGPDADRLFAAMEPVLRAFPPRPAQVLLRYGSFSDEHAPEVLLQL